MIVAFAKRIILNDKVGESCEKPKHLTIKLFFPLLFTSDHHPTMEKTAKLGFQNDEVGKHSELLWRLSS